MSETPRVDGTTPITVRMAYSDVKPEEAYIRVYPPNSGRPMEAPKRIRHEVEVHDARPVADELDLDVAGFALLRAPTGFTDFFNAEAVTQTYYPEVIALLKRTLDAHAVFVARHGHDARADRADAVADAQEVRIFDGHPRARIGEQTAQSRRQGRPVAEGHQEPRPLVRDDLGRAAGVAAYARFAVTHGLEEHDPEAFLA